jgi:hypothetical protein
LEPECGDFNIRQQPGIEERDERMGQFCPQQQPEETQPPWPWLRCASNVTPGAKERRIESDNAQAFFVIFMPFFFYSRHLGRSSRVKRGRSTSV